MPRASARLYVLGYLGLPDSLAVPLQLDKIQMALRLDDAVDLLDDFFTCVIHEVKRSAHQHPIGCEEIV